MKTGKLSLPAYAALICLPICVPVLGYPSEFGFEVGSPVAARDFRFKTAAFVFRTTGCSGSVKPEIEASAQGIAGGARQSMPLRVMTSQNPGVYAVFEEWRIAGKWVVVLKGSCGAAQAGAVIPVGQHGFVRDASKFFPRPANASDIDAVLRAIPEGGYK